MNGPEKKFFKNLKDNHPLWMWQRIEDSITSGIPDCLVLPRLLNNLAELERTEWITIELKAVPHTNVQLRASQIAWHVKANGGKSWVMNLDPKLKSIAAWRYPFKYEIGRKRHVKITSEPNFIAPSVAALRKEDLINPKY